MLLPCAVAFALASLAPVAQASTSAPDASKISLQPPVTIAQLDTGKLKGDPWRLAWSPDGTQMYIAATKQNGQAIELTNYVVNMSDGSIKKIDDIPGWASEYWSWKSAQAAPGAPAFKIQLDQQRTTSAPTARPMGGDLARGGTSTSGGMSSSETETVTNQTSNNVITTMRLKGAVIGTWTNVQTVPAGITFGWGPRGSDLIAFVDEDGRLVLMDEEGRKQRVGGTSNVRLPAWSDDGTKLAWIERVDKKKFRVQVASTK